MFPTEQSCCCSYWLMTVLFWTFEPDSSSFLLGHDHSGVKAFYRPMWVTQRRWELERRRHCGQRTPPVVTEDQDSRSREAAALSCAGSCFQITALTDTGAAAAPCVLPVVSQRLTPDRLLSLSNAADTRELSIRPRRRDHGWTSLYFFNNVKRVFSELVRK